jgi:amino acid transporter
MPSAQPVKKSVPPSADAPPDDSAVHSAGSGGPASGGLNTFTGVFTPSVLTILGIILFLRLGYVVGGAGLGRALLIIALANLITVLTSISLAAIATNMRVRTGGDYYLISRTLGFAFGGSIGLVLFLAQSVSIAFYCIGFAEAVTAMPAAAQLDGRLLAAGAVCFLSVLAWLGSDWAARFQFLVMGLLAAALFSFFTGGIPGFTLATLTANWSPPDGAPGFWVLFAVFFPAVTGFTQGVSMSGDLADPGKSLPAGTFLAVGVSVVVYFSVALVFAGTMANRELMTDMGAMKTISRFGVLIDAGVIAATLSSAMASFMGAPRILQSVAVDRVFPLLEPFGKGSGPSGNPRRGILLSAAISFIVIAMGNLNLIASVVAMFFLISYGLLNYATWFEARAASPSFRPRFKWFSPWCSLLGFIACLAVMLAISFAAGVVAVSILLAIHQYLTRTARPSRWADSRRAWHLSRVRAHLLAAAAEPQHDRDWRPQILAFSEDPDRRRRLLRFAGWIGGKAGFTTLVRVVEGRGLRALQERDALNAALELDISRQGAQAFSLAVACEEFETGLHTLLQAFGIGPLRANTVLINWLEPAERRTSEGLRELRFGRNLRIARRLGCNILILNTDRAEWSEEKRGGADAGIIDIWWRNDATGQLMLLLAYLMTRDSRWAEAQLRVIDLDCREETSALDELLAAARIDARICPVEPDAPLPSSGADMVFFPFSLRNNVIIPPLDMPLDDLLQCLPAAAMVLAAEEIDLDATPEEGIAGEVAAAADALARARKRVQGAAAAARDARDAYEKVKRQLDNAIQGTLDGEQLSDLLRSLEEAEREVVRTGRKAAREEAKEHLARNDAAAAGVRDAEEEGDDPEAAGSVGESEE